MYIHYKREKNQIQNKKNEIQRKTHTVPIEQKEEHKNDGFTLVELICVVALISILMAAAVPSYRKIQDKAAMKVAVSNAQAAYTMAFADSNLYMDMEGIEEETEEREGVTILENEDGEVIGAIWEGVLNGEIYRATYEAGKEPTVEVLPR